MVDGPGCDFEIVFDKAISTCGWLVFESCCSESDLVRILPPAIVLPIFPVKASALAIGEGDLLLLMTFAEWGMAVAKAAAGISLDAMWLYERKCNP